MRSITIYIFNHFLQVLMVYDSETWILVVKLVQLTKWHNEWCFLQLNKFLGVLFVFSGQYLSSWSYLYQLMRLTQQFFFFHDFIKFLWLLFYVKTHKTSLPSWWGGKFFSHLTMKVCRDLELRSELELQPQIRRERCFMLFCVGYGDFGLRW